MKNYFKKYVEYFFFNSKQEEWECTREVQKKYTQYKLITSVRLINFIRNSKTYKIRQDDNAQDFLRKDKQRFPSKRVDATKIDIFCASI